MTSAKSENIFANMKPTKEEFHEGSESTEDELPMAMILPGLAKGTRMFKIKSMSNFYRRHFFVDLKTMQLHYYPSNKRYFCCSAPNVDLQEVVEVRSGWNSDVFNRIQARYDRLVKSRSVPLTHLVESQCFSVVVNPDYRTINLVAPNTRTRNAWVKGLTHLIEECRSGHREEQFDRWLVKQFQKADRDGSGNLSFSECLKLLRTLNVNMDKRVARELFRKANMRKTSSSSIGGNESLDRAEFVSFYHLLESRPELRKIFDKYKVKNSDIMGPNELAEYLKIEQKSTRTVEECLSIIEGYENDPGHVAGCLTFRGFKDFTLSYDQDIFDVKQRSVNQDMSRPLNDYFIASSHNTYLRQGQLVGDSTMEAYVRALKFGIRCIEIDMWDGPDDAPIVFHGYTATTKILLRDVIEALKLYAFSNSEFPLIISLENHCSLEQQKIAADQFVEILGDFLYTEPVSPGASRHPSPNDLKRKIILKAKKMRHGTNGNYAASDSIDEEEEEELLEEEESFEREVETRDDGALVCLPKQSSVEKENLLVKDRIVGKRENFKDNSLDIAVLAPTKPASYQKLSRQLSDLVNICKATRFHDFEEVKRNWKFYEMASFSEGSAKYFLENNTRDFLNYNRRHVSRIYPSGLRTFSSNFVPTEFWAAGCQIAAMNVQAFDKGCLLDKAMFSQNGVCGYVLKPEYLRDDNYDPDNPEKSARNRTTLTLKVISGNWIPKPGQAEDGEIIDPYVTVKIYGHQLDNQKRQTNFVRDNGFNPNWNETLTFELYYPEVAVIVFTVKDNNFLGANRKLGTFACPVSCVQEGYRHVHLWDDHFIPLIPTTLFVHVTKTKTPSED